MKSNYEPIEDRVIVSVPKDEERTTKSGLIVPVDASELPIKEVIVEAVGDGIKANGQDVRMFSKPGDRVVIGRRTGVEYDLDGVTYRIIRQEEVIYNVKKES